jgi:hypothetical protein
MLKQRDQKFKSKYAGREPFLAGLPIDEIGKRV